MLLKKIVVAEDDDAIAHMVSMALGDAGYLCIRARDGAEAVQITKMHQPDLLVLDVMMPRMDGREVAAKLKQDVLLSKIPILMLTALADVESKIAGLDAGADDYVAKPFDLRELAARIRALIRANQRERDRNGVTDLPGSASVDEHIAEVLASENNTAIIQIGAAGFGTLISKVGQVDSVSFVKSMANFILAELRRHEGSFLGHLGGTDFVCSCPADKFDAFGSALVAGFDKGRDGWAGESIGEEGTAIRMLVGAVLSESVDESVLAKRLASTIASSRSAEGSNYVLYAEKS